MHIRCPRLDFLFDEMTNAMIHQETIKQPHSGGVISLRGSSNASSGYLAYMTVWCYYLVVSYI